MTRQIKRQVTRILFVFCVAMSGSFFSLQLNAATIITTLDPVETHPFYTDGYYRYFDFNNDGTSDLAFVNIGSGESTDEYCDYLGCAYYTYTFHADSYIRSTDNLIALKYSYYSDGEQIDPFRFTSTDYNYANSSIYNKSQNTITVCGRYYGNTNCTITSDKTTESGMFYDSSTGSIYPRGYIGFTLGVVNGSEVDSYAGWLELEVTDSEILVYGWGISDTAGESITAGSSITIAVVPVPTAIWLFGSGLIGLIGMARRKS